MRAGEGFVFSHEAQGRDVHFHIHKPGQDPRFPDDVLNRMVLLEAMSNIHVSFSFGFGERPKFNPRYLHTTFNHKCTSFHSETLEYTPVEYEPIHKRCRKRYGTVIFCPRIDVSWRFDRKLHTPKTTMHPAFFYWREYIQEQIDSHCPSPGNELLVITDLRWKLRPSLCEMFPPRTHFMIPHMRSSHFRTDRKYVSFWHQSVFLNLFTNDEWGWGGCSKFRNDMKNIEPELGYGEYSDKHFEDLKARWTDKGKTKYAQGYYEDLETFDAFTHAKGDFIFVPLQTIKDETIQYDSDFGVKAFVTELCEWTKESPTAPKIVFKGHPQNSTNFELKSLIESIGGGKTLYVSDLHIHPIIKRARAVYVINSGVGQEAMLMDAPVVSFGRSEYDMATILGNMNNLDKTWQYVLDDDQNLRKRIYREWFYNWLETVEKVSPTPNMKIYPSVLSGGRHI